MRAISEDTLMHTKNIFLHVFAGYATLPRPVSNGPSPEELEQQRRYLQTSSEPTLSLLYISQNNILAVLAAKCLLALTEVKYVPTI